jgi:ribosomal protein S18 acetylase RimI-like enzyme
VTVLLAMCDSEYENFIAETVRAYAAEKVAAGQWPQAESLALARQSLSDLLPAGRATLDNHLFTIHESATSASIGRLWFAAQERAGSRIAYVYDVSVSPEHQRKGHAIRAFHALEAEVVKLGLSGIALHVFGHNLAARALYAKLGYLPTNINMFKAVG